MNENQQNTQRIVMSLSGAAISGFIAHWLYKNKWEKGFWGKVGTVWAASFTAYQVGTAAGLLTPIAEVAKNLQSNQDSNFVGPLPQNN